MKSVRRCVTNNKLLCNIIDEEINKGKTRGGTIDNPDNQVNHKK
ncbi:Uncharacterised protein [Buttiauxella agrestis]|uniref:Uncharacterized protein n=1 Tax=Buttiauxella agrestis TaxID=82977 RepID=A0A381C3E2_9ENTR|nr:Uncharacterised protein [Buttiauxella agrestis]